MLKLRYLEKRDAGRMLEWMQDLDIVKSLRKDYLTKTLDDCISFINDSRNPDQLHLAVVDDSDTYMGTVSLKHITAEAAEFAIVMHKDALGKGYAIWSMNKMLRRGFEDFRLGYIYWCVSKDNLRAQMFYDKNHFLRCDADELNIGDEYTETEKIEYIWYRVFRDEMNRDIGCLGD